MRKFISLLVGGLCVAASGSVQAQISTPTCYYEDFKTICDKYDYLPSEWATYGNGEKVVKKFQPYFGDDGTGPSYIPFFFGSGTPVVACCTDFVSGAAGDQWLVTPPFKMDYGTGVLTFTAYTYQSSVTNRFEVLVSENGQAKEAFTAEPIFSGSVGFNPAGVKSQEYGINLEGYEGKEICIAFVNNTTGGGLFGISNIRAGQYSLSLKNNTSAYLSTGEKAYVNFDYRAYTPEKCSGLKVTLNTSEGESETLNINQTLGNNNTVLGKNIEFSKPITLSEAGTVDYTITITPKYEGAVESTIKSSVAFPDVDYPVVVVMEEMTSADCVACPQGMVTIEYLKNKYNGTEGKAKFIPIAVHDYGVIYPDPMGEECPEYFASCFQLLGASGLPSANLNRKIGGTPFPAGVSLYESEILSRVKNKSFVKCDISKVTFDEKEWKARVDFDVTAGFDFNDALFKVAVVNIENDVNVSNARYNQKNCYAGTNLGSVEADLGAEWVPYFEFFAKNPNPIKAKDMYYQEVARGIYPEFGGVTFANNWKKEVANSGSIEFEMNEAIEEWKNTEMVLLVMDAITGEILTASEFKADDYTLGAFGAVEGVEAAPTAVISREGSSIVVSAAGKTLVKVYAVDGRVLGSYQGDGELSIDGSAFSGVVIVKAETAEGVATEKMIW